MIRSIYSGLMWSLQPLLRRKLHQRAQQEPGYGLWVEQRFGRYEVDRPQGPCIWVHAVSLGESRAAEILLKALRQLAPDVHIVLTHGTATGRAQGEHLLREGDVQVWQPWDTPGSVQRFLSHFKPLAAIVLETEVWPNWVHQCQQQHIPMLLVNARMSEKSYLKSKRLSWLSRAAYQGLSGVWAQTEQDAERLKLLGANVVAVTGNLKFDAEPNAAQLALAKTWKQSFKRPVIMLASSREGEEAAWLEAVRALVAPTHSTQEQREAADSLTHVQWLIVPRHPQRFDEVAHLLQSAGWTVSRRSQWGSDGCSSLRSDDSQTIWLGDSLGEMALYYGLADAALLGGSFEPLGGQNLIEAAACGCPIVMGPHTFNFEQAAELALEEGAAMRVTDMVCAVREVVALVQSKARQAQLAHACQMFSQKHRGAAARTAADVYSVIDAAVQGSKS